MRLLDIGRAQVIGHMDLLWMTVQDQRGPDEDGVMDGWTDDDIANAAEWHGDSKVFVDAVVEAGFLDLEGESYRIHDYVDWMPKHVIERLRLRIKRDDTFRAVVANKRGRVANKRGRVGVNVHVHVPINPPTPLEGGDGLNGENGNYRAEVCRALGLTDNPRTARKIGRWLGGFAALPDAAPEEIGRRLQSLTQRVGHAKATPDALLLAWESLKP